MHNCNKGARETRAMNSGICLAVLCQVDWNNHRKLQKAQESHLVFNHIHIPMYSGHVHNQVRCS